MTPGAEPIIPVLAAVIEREGRYLLCRRPADKRHGGLWEFPGGKLEAGESLLAAAGRELAEELGVAVEAVGQPLFAAADPGSRFRVEFVPVRIAGTPSCLEHSELAWLPLAELARRPLAPSDRQFVLHLQAERGVTT